MYSTARRLGVISFLLALVNIFGFIMAALYFADLEVAFHWLFAWVLYLLTACLTSLLLTIAIRNLVEDSELEANDNALQVKMLRDRIEELEKKLK